MSDAEVIRMVTSIIKRPCSNYTVWVVMMNQARKMLESIHCDSCDLQDGGLLSYDFDGGMM